MASSADGNRLVAGNNAGNTSSIILSTDAGVNWVSSTTPVANCQALTSSSDGSKLAAVVYAGRVYTSVDYGANWVLINTSPINTGKNWKSITSSADGSRLAAVVTNGQVYTSSNFGANWTTLHRAVCAMRSPPQPQDCDLFAPTTVASPSCRHCCRRKNLDLHRSRRRELGANKPMRRPLTGLALIPRPMAIAWSLLSMVAGFICRRMQDFPGRNNRLQTRAGLVSLVLLIAPRWPQYFFKLVVSAEFILARLFCNPLLLRAPPEPPVPSAAAKVRPWNCNISATASSCPSVPPARSGRTELGW